MGLLNFDDNKVQAYINKAFAETQNDVSRANAWLLDHRGKFDPHDDDDELAAAEHYMFARQMVGEGKIPESVMKVLTLGYDWGKAHTYFDWPVFLARKLVGHTWSNPSFNSIRWGWRGCNDGAADLKRRPPK